MEATVPGQANSWRRYQQKLKRREKISHSWKLAAILIGVVVLSAILAGISKRPAGTSARPAETAARTERLIGKDDVRLLLAGQNLVNLSRRQLEINTGDLSLVMLPSLKPDLQQYLLQHFDRRNSRAIAVVALEPETGRVVAQASFNHGVSNMDPCLAGAFPAASIFKIVTAAAAIEKCNLQANSRISFNGYKHTLYKRQLTMKTNRYSNSIRFKDAFAQSVNPVFGKLGWHRLGKDTLENYSSRFGFNKRINYELEVCPSKVSIDQEPYHWAEIASGFNRRTTLSPLHGAMLAACIINDGKMMAPSMTETINTDSGKTVYRQSPEQFGRPIKPATARILQQMMETTIRSGTASRTFRNRRRDRVLSRLEIGGKTGSIYNRAHDTRYDWFVGWAKEKQSGKKLAVGAMVAHGEYIGVRAAQYAKMLFRRYFDNRIQVAGRK